MATQARTHTTRSQARAVLHALQRHEAVFSRVPELLATVRGMQDWMARNQAQWAAGGGGGAAGDATVSLAAAMMQAGAVLQ